MQFLFLAMPECFIQKSWFFKFKAWTKDQQYIDEPDKQSDSMLELYYQMTTDFT